jgi:hypothetical protein
MKSIGKGNLATQKFRSVICSEECMFRMAFIVLMKCCAEVKLLEEYEASRAIEDESLSELFEHWQGLQVGFPMYFFVVYAFCTNMLSIPWDTLMSL